MRDAIDDVFGEEFGGGVDALELSNLVEVLVVQRLEYFLQHVMGAADVDHNAVGVELVGDERRIDHEGRAMQRLRWAEQGAPKRMGDHDVVADFNDEQGNLL